jgi:NAD(P)H-quinone oxidoreductase subunit 4
MLSVLLIFPIIGVLVMMLYPQQKEISQLRQVALFIALVPLAWTIYLFSQFDLSTGGFQFSEFMPWLEPIGLNYHLSVDGISLPLVFLNSFLSAIAIYSTNLKIERSRLYYSLILQLDSTRKFRRSWGVNGAKSPFILPVLRSGVNSLLSSH